MRLRLDRIELDTSEIAKPIRNCCNSKKHVLFSIREELIELILLSEGVSNLPAIESLYLYAR